MLCIGRQKAQKAFNHWNFPSTEAPRKWNAGAGEVGAGADAHPWDGGELVIQDAPFNIIQAPVHHWSHSPAGAHPRGGPGGFAPPPWDLKNTIFSVFLPLNYVIYIFEVCFFLCFLLCLRTEEACSIVNSLRKVDFSHPTGHYTWKKFVPPSSENPGCAPAPLGELLYPPLECYATT